MSSTNGRGEGDQTGAGTSKKPVKNTIEKTYQKKSQLEHILLRPDTYIGSVEKVKEVMWIYDAESTQIIQKEIEYVPGLYKIFDEILVNAADNKQRDKSMDCIKIDINAETNTISVWNNGKGIPVVMHSEEKMYVPTMIFGHLLTSSNFNDEEEKVTGGRNGYGAKLCNIFSSKFIVETSSREYKRNFKQTFANNMTKTTEPKVKDSFSEDYTKITFCPDLEKFKMEKLDDDIVGLLSRRAFDVAASTRGVKVMLNGKRIPVKTFKDYVDLFIKGKQDPSGGPLKVIYETVNDRWEVAITLSDKGFQQMSFVNSIATTKGGRHVDYVVDMLVKQLIDVLKKKNKGGVQIKPFQVKTHMWIFINCLIVNPTFDSQTKENLTLQMKSFGSKCPLTDKFIAQVVKSGIVELILSWAKFKAQNELIKHSGKKQLKLKGIPKLEDANEAGTKNSYRCTLILTEGDSAKSLAVAGLSVIGRDHYGVFPLKGKLLNVREATHKQILENQEINNLIKILGLQYKKKYDIEEMKKLRYGKIMIMTDQDQDGSHIKGLLINFIHYNWPELLHYNFIEEFITPIVKAKKKKEIHSFYSLPEFEEWKTNTPNHHTFEIKYYKGLGTSTSAEAKEYFTDMNRHKIFFKYNGQQDDDHIVLAFSKKHIEHRKEWLTNFMVESKRRKELGLPEKYLYQKNTKHITYTDFINLELVLFSNADNIRSIPSLIDGLKPGQRKILYTCFKRNDKKEVKVAQLAGSVAEKSAYHHGEMSLQSTIVNLAQNFVGSNNINLLEPRGQFGTRMTGGKDAASARYIFTKLSPLTRLLFNPKDDPLLTYEFEDNMRVEPVWYIPIIPMVLVNGADGIGTGWMTKIPNYNPRELVDNIRRLLDGDELKSMTPWYKNYIGTIEDCGEQRYVVNGEISIISHNKVEITELPIGTWTQNYKENVLEPLLHGNEKVKATISDYKEYNTDTTVRFVVTLIDEVNEVELHKIFKLQTMGALTSMCAFDELGCIRKFESVVDMINEYYILRLTMYQKRKDYLEGMLGCEAKKLSAQARFISEKCAGTLTVENKKRKAIIDELIKRGYPADPVKAWKELVKAEDDDKPADEDETAAENDVSYKDFDYLLGMSMWFLTDEKKAELLKQRDTKLTELEILQKKTKEVMWRDDLDEFLIKLAEVEEKERKEAEGTKKTTEKKAVARKKIHVQDTLPSPSAQRVAPVISEEIKKKIQSAVKSKEKKVKRGLPKETLTEETDEFDEMVKNKQTLKDKLLGSAEDAEKKGRARKPKDGLKQTTLTFKKESKVNGSPKKRRMSFCSSDLSNDEGKSASPAEKTRVLTKRAASKPIFKYDLSGSSDEKSDEGDLEFIDNDAVKDNFRQEILASSDSEPEAPPRRLETSEDMFDSLVGRKKSTDESFDGLAGADKKTENAPKRKNPVIDTDSDSPVVAKKTKAKAQKRKEITTDSDSAPVANKPKAREKKPKAKTAKKPTKKAKRNNSDSEEEMIVSDNDVGGNAVKSSRVGRKAAQTKYVFSESESE